MPNIKLIVLNNKKTEIHGHRGCRGYFPENSLQAFNYAINLGIDAIELDVVISKDHQIVVSHEPYMHHHKCLTPHLKPIQKQDEKHLLIYNMNYEEVKRFECGLIPHPNFPLVNLGKAHKPLLQDVFNAAMQVSHKKNIEPITFNIEIKSEENAIGLAQPDYDTYVDLILDIVHKNGLNKRVIIQSFDKKILQNISKKDNQIPLSLLIEDEIAPLEHINQLGFKPNILASDYLFLNETKVKQLQSENVAVFAFTVNQISSIQNMLAIGVDAIITDYPDIAANVIKNYRYPEK